jgi:hypothetical protein
VADEWLVELDGHGLGHDECGWRNARLAFARDALSEGRRTHVFSPADGPACALGLWRLVFRAGNLRWWLLGKVVTVVDEVYSQLYRENG